MAVAVMASLVVSVKTVSNSVCGATGPVVTTTRTTVLVGISRREKLEMTFSLSGHIYQIYDMVPNPMVFDGSIWEVRV